MAERPYTLLSCGMSIDGYIDTATDERLVLSNDADLDRVDAAHQLYLEQGLGDRDDAAGMQYLIPGWTFDHKRPCLVR